MFNKSSISKIPIGIIGFSLFFFIITSLSFGQRNYLFENISIPEGLSNSEVHSIYQDSNGFLWISTLDGLNRYDGFSIKVFKNDPNDSTTIPDNYCSAITEDSEGFLWVAVLGNAIAKYDPKNESFKRYPIETGSVTNFSNFYTALTDSKGNLWFGSTNHEMQKYNRSEDRFEQVHLDSTGNNNRWGEIYNIIELKNGNILASDYSSGIKIYNENLNLFQPYYLKTNYSPDEVARIYEDASGNIWFGGKNKLIKYSPSYYATEDYDLFSLFKNPTNYDVVDGVIQDDEGFLWIGVYSQGMYRVDPKTKEIRKFDYTQQGTDRAGREIIQKIYKDKYSVLWIATIGGGIIKFDPLREPFNFSKFVSEETTNSNANFVTAIAGTRQDKEIIVGTSAKGLYSYNLQSRKSNNLKLNYNRSSDPNGEINIRSLAVDADGNKWFSYNNTGLQKIDKNNKLSAYISPFGNTTTGYVINSLKIDLSGDIWIASRNGFENYNPRKNEFTLLPTIMNKKMSDHLNKMIHDIPRSREPISSILKAGEASNEVRRFSLSQDQKVLIICVGEGRMFQGNNGLFDTGYLETGDGNLIWSMNELSKTFNDGGGFKNRIAVKCVDLKKGDYKIAYVSDVGHSYGNWNVLPPPDSLWWGIQVLNLSEAEYNSISELNEKEISSGKYLPMDMGNSIELSKRLYNVLWLGSVQNSFFKYDLTTRDFKQYNYNSSNKFSTNNEINFILEDRQGIVWIATQNNLMRFDPDSEEIERYDQKDGLPSNLITSIVEDLQGNLWISTSGGLSKLNKNAPREKWNFVNFDSRDGLLGFSSNRASWISKDGEIFLGSNDGINSFYPGKINVVKPDIVISDIKISDISLKSDSAQVKLNTSIMKLDELKLSHTQNDISFEFSSIHFSRPAKNKVTYKLDGFNNNWISSDRNYASFTNLDPGEYTFRVKGSNGDGIWNEEGKSIRINISPPWWQTTFAYIAYFFLFAGVVFGIDRIQRRRLLTRERNAAEIKEANLRAQLAEAENERKTKELEEARELQLSMLPKELPQLPNLDIAVYMKTATEVGGDYYDFNVGIDGTLTVVLGDATGHGMRAGTMVTSVKSLFNSYAGNPDILFTFHEMSRCLKQMRFQTLSMCLTMLKIQGSLVNMSAAGMPPLFIYRKIDKTIEEHVMKGMPLGSIEKFPYDIKETTLDPGDTIILMSDGFPELMNKNNEAYGYKRARNKFEEVAERTPEEIINFLKDEGSKWIDDQEPDDDVTFVVIKVK